jgi:hypothetical protein
MWFLMVEQVIDVLTGGHDAMLAVVFDGRASD